MAVSAALFANRARATTYTWDGGATGAGSLNWSNAVNWSADTVATSASTTDLVFAGTINTGTSTNPLVQNIANPFLFNSMTFASGAGAFFIAGGNGFGLTNTTQTITQSSNTSQSIANNFAHDGGNATHSLALAGTGTGVVTLSGIISEGSGQRQVAVTKSGATSTFVLSGANSYSDPTTISAGTLIGSNASAFGSSAIALNGGVLGLALTNGTSFGNNVTLGATATINSDRTTAGAGVTHTLGTLNISGAFTLNVTAGAGVTSGTAGVTFGNTTLTTNSTVFNPAANTILTLGSLTGNFSFTKQGSGQLTLSGTSSRSSGAVTLTAGTLELGAVSALGTTAVGLTLNGVVLDLATDATVNAYNTTVGGNVTIEADRATSGATVTHTLGTLNIGAFTLNVTRGALVTGTANLGFGATTLTGNVVFDTAANTNLTLGALSGNFTLTKQGAGILTLGTTSSRAAASTVNGGTVRLTNAAGFGASGVVTIGAGSVEIVNLAVTAPDFSLNNGATLLASGGTASSYNDSGNAFPSIGSAAAVTLSTAASGDVFTFISAFRNGDVNSNITVNGPGTIVLTAGSTNAAAYAGSWTVNGTSTTTLRLDVATALGNPNGGSNQRPITLKVGNLVLHNDSSTSFSNPTTLAGNFAITPQRATAGTSITHTLGALTADDGAGGAPNTLTLTVNHGANFSANNTGSLIFGAVALADNVNFVLNNTNGSATGVTTLGALNDNGVAKTIGKSGPGALTLGTAATSLVNGTALNITAGTVNSNNATALGTLVNVTLSTGATLNVGASQTLGALNSASSNTGAVTLGANTLTVGSTNNLTSSFAGVISGAGGKLIKGGTAKFTLSGANTYTGTTTISNGTLVVNGTHAGGDTYTVDAGGSLGGGGVITLASAKNVTLAGNVSPGNSVGSLTLTTSGGNGTTTGITELAAGGSYTWEINSQSGAAGTSWDLLKLGAVNVSATNVSGQQFTINIVSLNGSTPGPTPGWQPGTPEGPYRFTIATSTTNSFSAADLDKFAINTSQFQDAYPTGWSVAIGNSGGSLDLVYTPEPTSTATIVLTAAALQRRRRRSR